MNTRARINAIPVMMAASIGLGGNSTPGTALAQSTPAASGEMPTDLPEINLMVEDSGVTGMPESIAAGRYLVKVTGPEPDENGPFGAIFAMLPEGVTAESAYEEMMANPDDLPSWYLETHWAGSVTLYQGTESWAVIDLTPGRWITTTVFAGTPGVEFEVTGEMPADLPEVAANVTVDLLEMTFHITEGAFIAGDNVVTAHNAGAQVHFIDISQLPEGTTRDQVAAMMDSFMTGTPPAEGGLQEDDILFITVIGDLSPGVSYSAPVTLEPGSYFLSCWVPDPETFMPHAMMGMWDVITVE